MSPTLPLNILIQSFQNLHLTLIPFMLISTYIFKEKVKKSFNKVRNAVSNLNSFMQEQITGMSLVQIFNSEDISFKKFLDINNSSSHQNLTVWRFV